MSQTKPTFSKGNKSFVAALNRIADALWKHGVNPGGRPGWVETKDGWMPPLALSSAITESRWDLIQDPDDSELFVLRAPLVYAGVSELGAEIAITNDGIALAADKYVVLEVDDVTLDPYTLTLATADEETGGELEAYTFNETTDALTSAKFPLWYVSDEDTDGSFQVGGFHLTKLSGDGALVLSSHLVVVPDRPFAQFCPRLVSL
jgi:hypothetical protein